jgi:hypothetical protein
MSISDHIGTYAQGWVTGDTSCHMNSTAESFYFDDPNVGKIARADFEEYFAGVKAEVEKIRAGKAYDSFMDLTEVITKDEDDGTVTLSCWWAIPGTPIEGSGLIKIGEAGVLSEVICYYAKTAE